MYCENCGAKLNDGDVFCTVCGTKAVEETPVQPQQNPYYQSPPSYRQPNTTNTTNTHRYAQPEKKSSNMPLIIGLIVVSVLLLAAIIFVLVQVSLLKKDTNTNEAAQEQLTEMETVVSQEVTPIPTATPIPTVTVTPVPTAVPETTSSDYILPDSSNRYYTYSELYDLSEWELSIARNEIYARNGRMFNSAELQNYFNSKLWYVPRYSAESFDANQNSYFNQYEKANVKLIAEVESAKGYR